MKPLIEKTGFGSIVIAGEIYRHDVVIGLDGTVTPRRKSLTKDKYGTSHRISMEELEATLEPGTELLVVGSGMFGRVHLSTEAEGFLAHRNCRTALYTTAKVAAVWNSAEGNAQALIHITC